MHNRTHVWQFRRWLEFTHHNTNGRMYEWIDNATWPVMKKDIVICSVRVLMSGPSALQCHVSCCSQHSRCPPAGPGPGSLLHAPIASPRPILCSVLYIIVRSSERVTFTSRSYLNPWWHWLWKSILYFTLTFQLWQADEANGFNIYKIRLCEWEKINDTFLREREWHKSMSTSS